MRMKLIVTTFVAAFMTSGCAVTMEMHGTDDMHQMGEGHVMMMQEHHETDAQNIADLLNAYADAINIEDVDTMAALTVEDERFSIIEGGHANWGWVDYRDTHLAPEFASTRFQINSYGFSDIRVHAGMKYSYVTFNFALDATLDGEPYNKEGMGTAVMVRTAGGWRMVHLQTS